MRISVALWVLVLSPPLMAAQQVLHSQESSISTYDKARVRNRLSELYHTLAGLVQEAVEAMQRL